MFQLLGHVMQMPRIEELIADQHPELGIDPYIPSDDEVTAFNRQVVRPAFFDALELARAAGATSITDDLETPERFFHDIAFARVGDQSMFAQMSTVGSVQWADLTRINKYVS